VHYGFSWIQFLSGYPARDAYAGDCKYRSSEPAGHGKNNEITKEKMGKFNQNCLSMTFLSNGALAYIS